jgi:hypothetical protein
MTFRANLELTRAAPPKTELKQERHRGVE